MTPAVDPFMSPILERMRSAPPIDYTALPIAEARAASDGVAEFWRAGQPEMEARDLQMPTPAGPIRARLCRPRPGRLPLIVFVHGGGWCFGSVDSHENEMRRLALAAGAAVLGFDYRLAPEHPFPAALDDTLAAIDFAVSGALGTEIDASRLLLAGDSAGANIALAALVTRRGATAAPLAAVLFYGCYAPDFDTDSHERCGDGSYGLSSERMEWYWRNYLGADDFSTRGLAAPLRAELAGLPPLYLAAAGLDPLLDDTLALCRLLAAAGVAHRCDVVPGVIHGFLRMARELPAACEVIDAAGAFLAMQLRKTSPGGKNDGTQDIP